MSQYKAIVVDGCSALFNFYHPNIGFNFRTLCRLVRHNCEEVCATLLSHADVVYIVFDVQQHSAEAKNKWLKQKQREVEDERRVLPLNILHIVVETLKAIEHCHSDTLRIVTPLQYDASDYIAAIAAEESSASHGGEIGIVSMDAVFQRYKFNPNVVQIVLKRDQKMYTLQSWASQKKRLINSAPKIIPKQLVEDGIDLNKDCGPYMTMYTVPWAVRGTTDSFVRKYGSLYEVSGPLRDPAYGRLAITTRHEAAVEKFVVWDESSQQSILRIRTIDLLQGRKRSSTDLLANSNTAYEWLRKNDPYKTFEDNLGYAERTFARCAVLAEATCAYQEQSSYIATFGIFWDIYMQSLIKLLPQHPRRQPVSLIEIPNEVLLEELRRRLTDLPDKVIHMISALPATL